MLHRNNRHNNINKKEAKKYIYKNNGKNNYKTCYTVQRKLMIRSYAAKDRPLSSLENVM